VPFDRSLDGSGSEVRSESAFEEELDRLPRGLAGDAISIKARVVSVCDTWAAMGADRPYRRARSEADAIAELRRAAGSQLDPRVVGAFRRVIGSDSGSRPPSAVAAGPFGGVERDGTA